MLWPQNFKKYNLLCWYEEDFFFWGGGLVVCRWGELGLGRRRRNRGREGQQSWHVHIYINSFWRFHRQKLRRWFWQKNRHVTVRICHFKSLGDSVGNLKWQTGHVTVRAVFLNPSEKVNICQLCRPSPPLFLLLLPNPNSPHLQTTSPPPRQTKISLISAQQVIFLEVLWSQHPCSDLPTYFINFCK